MRDHNNGVLETLYHERLWQNAMREKDIYIYILSPSIYSNLNGCLRTNAIRLWWRPDWLW